VLPSGGVGRLCGLQSTEQPVETLLVGVVLFPVGEVPDVASATDVLCPRSRAGQNAVVQSHRVEHVGDALGFLVQGLFDLIGHPRTGKRVLREDEQELVIQPNRRIYTMPDLVTNLHIFGSKPTTHAFALQISVQTLGTVVIVAAIADEAGVVLDRTVHQRTSRADEGLRQTDPAKKHLGNSALRALQGISAQGGRCPMLHGLKPLDRTKVNITKDRPSYPCLIQVGSAEVGSAEVGSAEVGSAEVGTAEVGTAEVGTAEVGMAEVGTAEVGTAEVGTAEVGTAEVGMAEVGMAEVGMAEVGTAEVGSAEVGMAEVGSAEVGIAEVGSAEVGTAEVCTAEVGTAEVCIVEVCTAEFCTVEVCIAEVGPFVWMLPSPCIPDGDSLVEQIKLFLLYHRVLLPVWCSHYN